MYLFKAKRVEGFTAKEYEKVSQYVSGLNSIEGVDLEEATLLRGANELLPTLRSSGDCVVMVDYLRDLGQWKNVDFIHNWFQAHVQDQEDAGHQLALVTKENIESLHLVVQNVLADNRLAEELLPSEQMEYNQEYLDHVTYTKKVLEDTLYDIDFDEEVVLYQTI